MNPIDVRYFKLAVGESRIKHESPTDITVRCPICGDKISESLNKKTDEEKIETVKKRKETNLKRYGNENYTNREKVKETSLKKNSV